MLDINHSVRGGILTGTMIGRLLFWLSEYPGSIFLMVGFNRTIRRLIPLLLVAVVALLVACGGGGGGSSGSNPPTPDSNNKTTPEDDNTTPVDNNNKVNGVDGLADCELNPDCDTDGVPNSVDMDIDGDGLIEISNAVQLHGVRFSLDGAGRRLNVLEGLNTSGCPTNGCIGYELIKDISLTDFLAKTNRTLGWFPIGHNNESAQNEVCSSSDSVYGDGFSAIFEGNGRTISGLYINRPALNCLGLFSYTKEGGGAEIRNVTVIADSITGTNRLGGLIGYADSVTIRSTSAIVESLHGQKKIGGLIGFGKNLTVSSSYAVISSLTGRNTLGGLIGKVKFESSRANMIDSSYAISNSLNGSQVIGGLVGSFNAGKIVASYAISNTLRGNAYIGGLLGVGNEANIIASYAMLNSLLAELTTRAQVSGGGLLANAGRTKVVSSYVIANSLEGNDRIGGFMGNASDPTSVDSSYAVAGSLTGDPSINSDVFVAFFGGVDERPDVNNAYWNNGTTNLRTVHTMLGPLGQPKTAKQLTSPEDYEDIYITWDDGVDLDGGGVDDITIYCDRDANGAIDAAERVDNKIWEFGTSQDYPAIRCTPNTPQEQRDWLAVSGSGQLMFDSDVLDDVLDSYFSEK